MPPTAPHHKRLNSHDEDLLWIIDRLVARTNASFGLLIRFLEDEPHGVVLASSNSLPARLIPFFATLSAPPPSTPEGHEACQSSAAPFRQLTQPSPEGELRLLSMGFQPAPNVRVVAIVARTAPAEAFSADEEETAATLYPVLRRYVKLWWLHRTERHRASALCTALDLSGIGVILLNQGSKVVFANNRARALLEAEDGLRSIDHRIAAVQFTDAMALQTAIHHAIHANCAGRQTETHPQYPHLALQRRAPKRALVATVASVEHVPIDPDDPAVIVYVLDPDQDVQQLLRPICRIYRLTDAEFRVVYHLVSGLTVVEAAREMQVQPDTARSYLKQIFIKTDTNRQADLVRVMLSSLLRADARIAIPAR